MKRAPSIPEIERAAAALGVEFEQNLADDMAGYSPKGKVFAATDCHTLIASGWDLDRPADVRRRFMEDLSRGLRACDDPACEHCQEGE